MISCDKEATCFSIVTLVAMIGLAHPAEAHVTYRDLDAPPTLVTTTFSGVTISDPCMGKAKACQSSNAFTRYGWRKGTEPGLGDSHQLTVNAEFWKFHLNVPSKVTLTFTQGEAGMDPAFSLYQGLLPVAAHDDTPVDPLNPADETTFCATASPTDAHSLPYTYILHDGFRDTASYSTMGGLDTDSCSPVNPYVGQFDAFASWSMANASGAWSRIQYVGSVSATPFTGHDGGSHNAGNTMTAIGTGESLTIALAAGDYFVAAGGEACSDTSAPCTLPRLYGTVTLSETPISSVPALGPIGLIGELLGLLLGGLAMVQGTRRPLT